jgi:hypothetical protein
MVPFRWHDLLVNDSYWALRWSLTVTALPADSRYIAPKKLGLDSATHLPDFLKLLLHYPSQSILLYHLHQSPQSIHYRGTLREHQIIWSLSNAL